MTRGLSEREICKRKSCPLKMFILFEIASWFCDYFLDSHTQVCKQTHRLFDCTKLRGHSSSPVTDYLSLLADQTNCQAVVSCLCKVCLWLM